MQDRRVIVIGAGVAGLVAAAELAAAGCEVTLLERAAVPGGKLSEVEIAGRRLDAGPTVFTMRWVFDALFDRLGARLDDHLELQPLQILARHAWDGGARFDLHADLARSLEEIGRFAGAAEARRYHDFAKRSRRIYRTLESPFLAASRPSTAGLVRRLGLRGLPDLMGISPFGSMWGALGTHFQDARLRQLFGRYATYCGSSPFRAPATLMLIAHVEREGVWSLQGGMHRLARVLAGLVTGQGGRIRYQAEVERLLLRDGRIAGVQLAGGSETQPGERLEADAVVFNGDTAALETGLLGGEARRAVRGTPPARRSLSALTWHLVAPARGFPLLRHNIFFGGDSRREFDELFNARRLPSDPTIYVCAQDRADDGEPASVGRPERLMCLVNAPATADTRPLTAQEIERCEQLTFERLARCGLRLLRQPALTTLSTPADFARRFPATGGALYGPASHGWRAAFTRPDSHSRIPGLYLAGGSTHPGAGVPMAALSGHLAAASVMADRPRLLLSTPIRPLAATSGGTSTRSATTETRR